MPGVTTASDAVLPPHRLPTAFRTPGVREDVRWRSDRPFVYLTLGTALGSVSVLRRAIDGLVAAQLPSIIT